MNRNGASDVARLILDDAGITVEDLGHVDAYDAEPCRKVLLGDEVAAVETPAPTAPATSKTLQVEYLGDVSVDGDDPGPRVVLSGSREAVAAAGTLLGLPVRLVRHE